MTVLHATPTLLVANRFTTSTDRRLADGATGDCRPRSKMCKAEPVATPAARLGFNTLGGIMTAKHEQGTTRRQWLFSTHLTVPNFHSWYGL